MEKDLVHFEIEATGQPMLGVCTQVAVALTGLTATCTDV